MERVLKKQNTSLMEDRANKLTPQWLEVRTETLCAAKRLIDKLSWRYRNARINWNENILGDKCNNYEWRLRPNTRYCKVENLQMLW